MLALCVWNHLLLHRLERAGVLPLQVLGHGCCYGRIHLTIGLPDGAFSLDSEGPGLPVTRNLSGRTNQHSLSLYTLLLTLFP